MATNHPNATPAAFDLSPIKVLSFDCYGTLVDWETGLMASLRPLLARLDASHDYVRDPRRALRHLNANADDLERRFPSMLYPALLARAYLDTASQLGVGSDGDGDAAKLLLEELEGEAAALGRAVGSWAPFPDTVEGLGRLAREAGVRMVILSNVDEGSIRETVARLRPAEFALVLTAEAIGSYKPDPRNFAALAERVKRELGVAWEDGQHVHVARSLVVDHVATKEMGMRSIWISRGGETAEGRESIGGDCEKLWEEGKVRYGWRFDTIGDMCREILKAKGLEG